MYELFPPILEQLRAARSVAVATVVRRKGSLPMARDAKLLVLEDGSIRGTVGGGCLEAEVYAIAQRLLQQGGASVDEFHLNEVEEGTGGHVCGGSVTVLTRTFQPGAAELAFVERAVAEAEDAELTLASHVAAAGGHVLLSHGVPVAALAADLDAPFEDPEAWFTEPVAAPPLLIVFGAGHCGVAIGRAAATVGFRVWMLEDRPGFLNAEELGWAERLRLVDFARLPALQVDVNTSLVIVTRGHEHDLAILRQLLPTSAGYLGMIGSRRKRALFERILADEGHVAAELAGLHSPMGLDIGAETPAEIAVAVVAELLVARRGSDSDARRRRAGIGVLDGVSR